MNTKKREKERKDRIEKLEQEKREKKERGGRERQNELLYVPLVEHPPTPSLTPLPTYLPTYVSEPRPSSLVSRNSQPSFTPFYYPFFIPKSKNQIDQKKISFFLFSSSFLSTPLNNPMASPASPAFGSPQRFTNFKRRKILARVLAAFTDPELEEFLLAKCKETGPGDTTLIDISDPENLTPSIFPRLR